MKQTLISIIIPAYKEEKNISVIYQELTNLLSDIGNTYTYEIIFVNDGSPDTTRNEIKKLGQKDKNIKGIHLSRNFGHQGALTAGLDKANGDAIISMDCDMQDPPNLILEMIKQWENGFEIVYARRKNRNDTFFKKYTALLYYKLLSFVSEIEIPRNVGDFRLIDKKVLDAFKGLKEKDRYVRGMFARLGFKTTFVDFDRPERIHGTTGYTWKKMFKLATDGILNFSMFPLKLGAFVGFFVIIFSLFFFIYVLFDSLIYGTNYPLYKRLSIAGFGFLGLQFIFIWMLGEYIGRIYNETRERPIYIVSEQVNL